MAILLLEVLGIGLFSFFGRRNYAEGEDGEDGRGRTKDRACELKYVVNSDASMHARRTKKKGKERAKNISHPVFMDSFFPIFFFHFLFLIYLCKIR